MGAVGYNAGDESLTAIDAAGGGWGQALTTDPRIDRDRLLDALLSALGQRPQRLSLDLVHAAVA